MSLCDIVDTRTVKMVTEEGHPNDINTVLKVLCQVLEDELKKRDERIEALETIFRSLSKL